LAPIAALSLLVACGLDPSKVASHAIYADDGDRIQASGHVSFAVVGDTRTPLGAPTESDAVHGLIADVAAQVPARDLAFVVLTGDYVRRSSSAEWSAFSQRWTDVLLGDAVSDSRTRREVVAMPGPNEAAGDPSLRGYGAAFAGTGAEIGHNRVGSWSRFDVDVDGETWRFVFLDANRDALGSRWDEQVFWLPGVVSGDGFDHLLVFLSDPLVTLAQGAAMDAGDAPSELLGIVDDNSGIMKLLGVFSGGPTTNEAFLPSGSFGELHVVAGNGGVGGQNLARWGDGTAAGVKELALEAMFDVALMEQFDHWAASAMFSERTIDHAKARGEWEGFGGEYDGTAYPVQGWWIVDLKKRTMDVTFRMRRFDGTFRDIYAVRYSRSAGWVGEVLEGSG
jgi:hypothetical protein